MASCDVNILEKRGDLSRSAKHVIETVTSQMGILPVGTFKYNVFKYPGDIDIFETIEGCCSYNVAKLNAAQKIQQIITNIISDKTIIFTEFKAGYDFRYKIYTGVVDKDITDYNSGLIRRDINNLFEAGLLTQPEYDKLFSLAKDIPRIDDLIKLNESLRDFWIVRWNSDEIIQGYKILRGNYKLYLDVAISQGSIVKLDTIAYVDGDINGISMNGRYIEVTNFFLISSIDKAGNRIILSEELADYGQSLLLDVYKYYEINPLKSVKRLWMYLAFKRRLCDLSIFTPLFSSSIALYSQILSDIDVAIALLSPKPSYKGFFDLNLLISSLNSRLKLLNGLCINEYIRSCDYCDIHIIIRDLETLRECLQNKINTMTYEWLTANNIDVFALAQSS